MSDNVIGIDLGTTNSAMAVVGEDNDINEPEIVINEEGERTTPSIVAFEDGTQLVGTPAKNQAIQNPNKTIMSIKRHMGSDYTVRIGEDEYTPEEISGMILQKLKRGYKERRNEEVEGAVITVPAYFNDKQRQATKTAGEIAGFNVKRIINEPTAAALAYGIDDDEDKNILVYDLGGGTFDVSVLDIGMGVFEVISTNGDNDLGGDDWDKAIINRVVEAFEEEYDTSLRDDSQAMQRLNEAAEEAKIQLTNKKQTEVNLPFITSIEGEPVHIEHEITRSEFEQMTEDLIDRTEEPVLQAIEDAGLETEDIDDILLVGGSTRMPQVEQKVEEIIGKEPLKELNPDEVVAKGAAVQGELLEEENSDILLVDVTPLSLGVEVKGGEFEPIIEKNTRIPAAQNKTFTTAYDEQDSVDIQVYQGNNDKVAKNEFLANFTLKGIEPQPAGVPRISVDFKIDADGILDVSATNKKTGDEEGVTIEGGVGLESEEVEEMKEKAEEREQQKEEQKELVDSKNEAQELLSKAEEVLGSEDTEEIEDVDRLKELTEALEIAVDEENKEKMKQYNDEIRSLL